MFLVDNDQAEVFELHILLQQSMSADNNINDTFGRSLQNLLYFFACQKTANHFDAHWVIAEPLAESLQVLLRASQPPSFRNRRLRRPVGPSVFLSACPPRYHRWLAAGPAFLHIRRLLRTLCIMRLAL